MPASRSLISELLSFVRNSPDSPSKAPLIDKAEQYQRARRRRNPPVPPPKGTAVDRLPGVVAAIGYLLLLERDVSAEQFTQSMNQRTRLLIQHNEK